MRTLQSRSKRLTARLLPAIAAAAVAGMLGTGTANAGHGTGGDPYVFTNGSGPGAGDQLWSNPDNWNQPEPPGPGHVAWINFTTTPAIINYAAPSISELVIGQGGGDGAVHMTTGGSITATHVNMAWNSDRSGTWDQDGGSATVGELRMGRGSTGNTATVNLSGGTLTTTGPVQMSSRTDEGGFASANSFLNVSGGTLTIGGLHANGVQGSADLQIGHLGGTATMLQTDGTVYAAAVLVANLGASSAVGSLTVNGGELRALQIGVGGSSGTATNVGHFTIGGDALVTTVNHIFLRPDGRGNFTVNGSQADIQLNRPGATGFEVTNGSVVNFNFDSGGSSTVKIPNSTMRFSGPDGVLNVDASAVGPGTYDLFTFSSYFAGDQNTSTNRWGTTNLTFAPGLSGEVLYNAQSIQLSVVPEPAGLGLLAIAGVFALRRRRA